MLSIQIHFIQTPVLASGLEGIKRNFERFFCGITGSITSQSKPYLFYSIYAYNLTVGISVGVDKSSRKLVVT
mgnify:CR=1 FL=1